MDKQSSTTETQDSLAQFYDDSFAEIFSNVRFLKSLLKDFVKEPWVEKIDFEEVTVERSVFKGIRKNKRESDLLIQFKLKGKESIFLYVLLEFQSSREAMLLRLQEYLQRAYAELSKKFRFGKVPVIIPIVLYNGEEKWTSKQKFSEMLQIPMEAVRRFIPDFEFILIDVGRIPDQKLEELKSEVPPKSVSVFAG